MKRISKWKKSILLSCTAGLLAFTVVENQNRITVWAMPSEGKCITDNVVVRESAVDGAMVGGLSEGQEITIQDETQGEDGKTWYEISYEVNGSERTGWVRSDLIETSVSASTGTAENSETENTESQTEPDGTFRVDNNSFAVAESIPTDMIPDGFSETTITYNGEEVPALQSENASVFLLYLQNTADAEDERLFVYDEIRNEVLPFIQMETGTGYVILTNIPEEETERISDRFAPGVCELEDGSIMAYQLSSADEMVSGDASLVDFYYVYGTNELGVSGWYVYDSGEGTIQRNLSNMQYQIVSAPEEDADSGTGFEMDAITRMVTGVLALVCLLLLVLVIIFSIRYRRLRRILEEATSDDEEDTEAEYQSGSEQKGRKRREKLQQPENKKENREIVKPEKEIIKGNMPCEDDDLEAILGEAQRQFSMDIETPYGKVDLLDLDLPDDEIEDLGDTPLNGDAETERDLEEDFPDKFDSENEFEKRELDDLERILSEEFSAEKADDSFEEESEYYDDDDDLEFL